MKKNNKNCTNSPSPHEPTNIPYIRVALIIIKDDSLLLCKHRKQDREYWVFPGGHLEYGETLREAAVRELEEEASATIEPDKLVLIHESIPPNRHRHIVNLYFTASITSGTPQLGTDPIITEVSFIPKQQLTQITIYPDIIPHILRLWDSNFELPVLNLGNIWQE